MKTADPSAPKPGPCHAEAGWIAARPEFEASDRLKSLLCYLAARSDDPSARPASQVEIARDVMRLGQGFDPANDAHVRIEVARLRTALAAFYSRLTVPRARRLDIPKGAYKTQLTCTPTDPAADAFRTAPDDPLIAVGILCADDLWSRRCGFELECELLCAISASDYTRDGLLSFAVIGGSSLAGLADQAERRGAAILMAVHVAVEDDLLRVSVTALCSRTRRVLGHVRVAQRPTLGLCEAGHRVMACDIVTELLDPINGSLLAAVFKGFPQARISILSDVFTFMKNQDRRLLPRARAAAEALADGSLVARVFSTDMTRASYCFATDPDLRDAAKIVDMAESLAEQAPDSAWANLSIGYAGIIGGRPDLLERAIATTGMLPVVGAQRSDLDLLKVLAGAPGSNASSDASTAVGRELPVFDTIRLGLAALGDRTDAYANDVLAASKDNPVFWVQAFQIAALADRGDVQRARAKFRQMKRSCPKVEDYAHRAVSTMIPDAEVKGRILSGLSQAAV